MISLGEHAEQNISFVIPISVERTGVSTHVWKVEKKWWFEIE